MTTHLRSHRPVLGVALKLLSVVLLTCMAACVKHLGQRIPAGEIIFARGLFAVATLILLARFVFGMQILKTDRWQRHAGRSVAGTISMYCMFAALAYIPMVDFTAISFSSPMFVTVLAMLFLGERIHAFRWAALALGLVGVLIMTGPHLHWQGGSPLGITLAFGAALFSAVAMIALRSMSAGEHAITITFYFLLTATVCSLLTLPFGWVMPEPREFVVLLLTGLFGVTGQIIMTSSYQYAEASTIAPLDYSSIVISATLGYWLFSEVPVWTIWVGAPLVIASGLIILWREYVRQRDYVSQTAVND